MGPGLLSAKAVMCSAISNHNHNPFQIFYR